MKNSKYAELLKRPEWKSKRAEVLEKSGHICEKCGSDKNLQVHHPKYVRGKMPWEYDDLQTLCASCHRKADWERIKNNTPSSAAQPDTLRGKFFHSFDQDAMVEWQGQVLGPSLGGYYLVQLFSWAMGENSNCALVHFSEMTDWYFYQDQESMRYSYDDGQASRRKHKLNCE